MLHQIDGHAVRLLVKLRRHPPTKKFRENELAEEYELSPHWLRHGRFKGYGPAFDRLAATATVRPKHSYPALQPIDATR